VTFRVRDCGPRVRFCDLADGTSLALGLRQEYQKGWKVVRRGAAESETTGLSPIVAWSFEEVLRRALDGEKVDQPPDDCLISDPSSLSLDTPGASPLGYSSWRPCWSIRRKIKIVLGGQCFILHDDDIGSKTMQYRGNTALRSVGRGLRRFQAKIQDRDAPPGVGGIDYPLVARKTALHVSGDVNRLARPMSFPSLSTSLLGWSVPGGLTPTARSPTQRRVQGGLSLWWILLYGVEPHRRTARRVG
jgi:hypothetical protein